MIKRIKYAWDILNNPMKYEKAKDDAFHLNKLRTQFHLLYKEHVTYSGDFLYTHHSADFLYDERFIKAYNEGALTDDGTLIKNVDIRWRIHLLCWAALQASKLEGDFVDCGVHTGIFARSVIDYTNFDHLNKTYYLLDTFEGMDPKYSSDEEIEKSRKIGYSAKKNLFNKVSETFAPFKTKIIKGAIPETLAQVESKKIAFLSIDMNCVIPEVEALEYFWDKLVPGAFIILDDYGYMNKQIEQKRAHDEFAKSKNVEILYFPTCQGVIIKP
jgi:O-methyltransferase